MTGDNERLTELMLARLRDLGMKTWRDLSTKAGISYETLRALRAGGNPSDGTTYALEKALRWEPGSVRAILAGGDPTVEDADDVVPTDELAPTDVALLLRRFGHVPEVRAAIEKAAGGKREPRVGDDFAERIERILNNPAALKRADDLLRAARIPEIEEEDERRGQAG